MAEFSTSDAIGTGFSLVKRRPVAVILWGVACCLIAFVPLALLLPLLANTLPDVIGRLQSNPDDVDAIFRLQSRMLLLNPLLLVASLVSQAVLTGAVFRAVLEPENRSFFSLRLGRQELWLMLLRFAMGFVLAALFVAILLAGAIVGCLGWLLGGVTPEPWTGWVRALFIVTAVVGAFVAIIWVTLRLSLAGPMTFADKQFRLFESWTLTRGHAWKLFGLALLLGLIGLLIGVVVDAVLFLGVGSTLFRLGDLHSPAHVAAHLAELIALATPVIAIVGLFSLLVTGPVTTIFLAPWAYAYRELSRDLKPIHPPVF